MSLSGSNSSLFQNVSLLNNEFNVKPFVLASEDRCARKELLLGILWGETALKAWTPLVLVESLLQARIDPVFLFFEMFDVYLLILTGGLNFVKKQLPGSYVKISIDPRWTVFFIAVVLSNSAAVV